MNKLLMMAAGVIGAAVAIQAGIIPWLGQIAADGLGQFVELVLIKNLGIIAMAALAIGIVKVLLGWKSEHHEHGMRLLIASGIALVVVFLGGWGFVSGQFHGLSGLHLLAAH